MTERIMKRILSLIVVAALFSYSLTAMAQSESPKATPVAEPIVIAHLADPQFGYDATLKDEEAYQAGLRRCEAAIAEVNRLKPDIVVFAGDMVTRWKDLSRDWPRLLKTIEVPWIVTVGNHDMPSTSSAAQKKAFEEVFGADRFALTVKGWRIISLNGQLERAVTPDSDYLAWRDRELKELAASGRPGIVLTHQPPFVKDPDEKDTHENYPLVHRRELLDRLVGAGVRYVLAGHTHRMRERAYCGMRILNAETTSNNFDRRPFGFRLLKTSADGSDFEWTFIPCGD